MKLAISPCPNDTYIFHWMIHNPEGPSFEPVYLDIQELNEQARAGKYELSKMSCYAYLKLKDKYTMLEAGGALGRGCGPLLVSSQATGASSRSPEELLQDMAAQQQPILIPGMETTASLMLRMYLDAKGYSIPLQFLRYDRILPALQDGQYEAGVIIHEERFTYPSFQTSLVQDLGEWWEQSTGSPIPLGLIAIRNDHLNRKEEITQIIRKSLEHANERPLESTEYIRCHAQAMDEQAIRDHIALYVNDYSLDMGAEGLQAMEELERRARQAGAL
ncbi:MAG: hypothetical protein CMN77_20840 [Spirochaetaceae bacterium]|nr:hypothetical protein [Spirochaetaceae bacterium]|tara:strand:- start:10041 stop:10865 length:825 start_codon:yes stop_codon:yes gene_type:complete